MAHVHPIDYYLDAALNRGLAGVPESWQAKLVPADTMVLSTALYALQDACNRAVANAHDTFFVRRLGSSAPEHAGPGYVQAQKVEAKPKHILEHLSNRKETVAGAVALGYVLRDTRGDHSHALRATTRKSSLGVPLRSSANAKLAAQAYRTIGRRPTTNTLLSPGLYAIAIGMAGRVPREVSRRSTGDKLGFGLYSLYEQAYENTGGSVTLKLMADIAHAARRRAYEDIVTQHEHAEPLSGDSQQWAGFQQEVGKTALLALNAHMGALLHRPYPPPEDSSGFNR